MRDVVLMQVSVLLQNILELFKALTFSNNMILESASMATKSFQNIEMRNILCENVAVTFSFLNTSDATMQDKNFYPPFTYGYCWRSWSKYLYHGLRMSTL